MNNKVIDLIEVVEVPLYQQLIANIPGYLSGQKLTSFFSNLNINSNIAAKVGELKYQLYQTEIKRLAQKVFANFHMVTGGKDGVSIEIECIENAIKYNLGVTNITRITGDEENSQLVSTRASTVIEKLDMNRALTQEIKKKLTSPLGFVLETEYAHLEAVTGISWQQLIDRGVIDEFGVVQSSYQLILDNDQLFNSDRINIIKELLQDARSTTAQRQQHLFSIIYEDAAQIYVELLDYYLENPEKFPLNSLIHNFFSLPVHPSATIAIFNLIKDLELKSVLVHHDFMWERKHFHDLPEYWNMVAKFFDPAVFKEMDWVKHATINRRDAVNLKRRSGLDSMIIYNIDDFSRLADYNRLSVAGFRQMLTDIYRIPEDAFLIVQGTRCVERKQIQLAEDLLAGIIKHQEIYPGREFHLVIFGDKSNEAVDNGGYYDFLIEQARENGCSLNIHFIKDHVSAGSVDDPDNNIWSFQTAYQAADMVTYFSKVEGFGNNMLEAIRFSLTSELLDGFSKASGYWQLNKEALDLSKQDQLKSFMENFNQLFLQYDISLEQGLSNFDFEQKWQQFISGLNIRARSNLLEWVNDNKDILPPLFLIGGEGIGNPIYLKEIKLTGISFEELTSLQVDSQKVINQGKYFDQLTLKEPEQYVSEVMRYTAEPEMLLRNLFRSITNFYICMRMYSYETFAKKIARQIKLQEMSEDGVSVGYN